MAPLSPQDLLTQLNWRYATKKFDPSKKIPSETWNALEQSLILSPSSFGLQPWKFFVIKDKALRAKLRPHSWDQAQITDASHLIVFAQKTNLNPQDVQHFVDRIVDVRKIPAASMEGYQQMMVGHVTRTDAGFSINEWAKDQVYIALGFFLTSAAVLGIDACPMEGFDAKQYDQILGLANKGYKTCVVATAGYRCSDDVYAGYAKVRFPAEEIIVHL